MNATTEERTKPIVEMWAAPKRTGLFTTMFEMLPGAENEPMHRPDAALFACRRGPDGPWEVHKVSLEEARQAARRDEDVQVVSVTHATYTDCALSFSGAIADEHGYSWDVNLSATWRISDATLFLTQYALDLLSPGASLSRDLVEAWIARLLLTDVRDPVQEAAREHGACEVTRDRDILPPRWWTAQLRTRLAENGLLATVEDVHWESQDAAKAEAERQKILELEKFEQERQRERQIELSRMREDTAYALEVARLASERADSEVERERKLQERELEHRTRLIEVEAQAVAARHAAEGARLEFELKAAKLRNDIDVVRDAPKAREEIEQRHKQLEDALAKMAETLGKLADLPERMLAKLSQNTQPGVFQALERLTSPEFGFNPEELDQLGFTAVRQKLVRLAREKAIADGESIRLMKTDLQPRSIRQFRMVSGQTRDVGTASVHGLPVGSPLQLDLVSSRPGFVTLLNIGTSGKVWLISPNAFVTATEAKVTPQGASYTLPGDDLLPEDELSRCGLEFREMGPAGWEHIVAFVSDEPLVPMEILCRTSPDRPFADVSSELKALAGRLATNRPETWSAAALSFLVSEE